MNILIIIGIIFLFLLIFLIGFILGSFYLILFKKNTEYFYKQRSNETTPKDYDKEISSIKNEISSINSKLSTSTANNEQIINEWLNGGEYNE